MSELDIAYTELAWHLYTDSYRMLTRLMAMKLCVLELNSHSQPHALPRHGPRPLRQAQEVFALTHALLERNPYALEAMPVHLTAALELRKKNELFLRGHRYAALGVWSCTQLWRHCAFSP